MQTAAANGSFASSSVSIEQAFTFDAASLPTLTVTGTASSRTHLAAPFESDDSASTISRAPYRADFTLASPLDYHLFGSIDAASAIVTGGSTTTFFIAPFGGIDDGSPKPGTPIIFNDFVGTTQFPSSSIPFDLTGTLPAGRYLVFTASAETAGAVQPDQRQPRPGHQRRPFLVPLHARLWAADDEPRRPLDQHLRRHISGRHALGGERRSRAHRHRDLRPLRHLHRDPRP